jgi:hypothetical protein
MIITLKHPIYIKILKICVLNDGGYGISIIAFEFYIKFCINAITCLVLEFLLFLKLYFLDGDVKMI